ncbi:MAG: DoxX family protein [Deltaproteobacteria bacterium]|nr:DoxX family protein [Deltaproteobacteria bacterium]
MSLIKRILLYVMAAFYIFAGVMHFVRPEFYRPMMPPYLPWHDFLIFLSGVAEVGLGAAVLVPAIRPLAAWGIILLLIAIFPANIHIALNNVPLFGNPEGAGILNWVRLPLQGVLILWAWWYTHD